MSPEDIKQVLTQFSPEHKRRIYHVWLANTISECGYVYNSIRLAGFRLVRSRGALDCKERVSKYHFYNLIYKLKQFGFDQATITATDSVEDISKKIAQYIVELKHQEQKLELKRLYYKWLRSLSKGEGRSFIKRLQTDEEAKYDKYKDDRDIKPTDAEKKPKRNIKPGDKDKKYQLLDTSVDINDKQNTDKKKKFKTKTRKILKSILESQVVISVILTSVSVGLLPAVLGVAPGGLLFSILLVGVPSIIINYVLFNKSVKELIKEISHYLFSYSSITDLIKDLWSTKSSTEAGKSNKFKIIAFIIAIAGGLAYGVLMFENCPLALNLIFSIIFPFLPAAFLGHLVLVTAVIMTAYAALTLTAMYFHYISEIMSELLDYVAKLPGDSFIEKTKSHFKKLREDNSIVQLMFKGGLIVFILLGASYLRVVESLVFYTSAMVLFNQIKVVSILIVIVAAPANYMFTTTVYLNLVNVIKNLPSKLAAFWKYLSNNCSNPIAFYEDVKLIFTHLFLWPMSFFNALGTGQAFASESGIRAFIPNALARGFSSVDCFGANTSGILETIGNHLPVLVEDESPLSGGVVRVVECQLYVEKTNQDKVISSPDDYSGSDLASLPPTQLLRLESL